MENPTEIPLPTEIPTEIPPPTAIPTEIPPPTASPTDPPPPTDIPTEIPTEAPTETPPDEVLPTATAVETMTATPLPTSTLFMVGIPFIETFDTGTGWTPGGSWWFDTSTAFSGAGWYASTALRDTISTLESGFEINLWGASHPQLTFWQKAQLGSADSTAVDILPSGYGAWIPVDQQFGLVSDWTLRVVDLSVYAGMTIRVRFRVETPGSSSSTGYWIDQLTIQQTIPTETPTEPSPEITLEATSTETPTLTPTFTAAATLTPTATYTPTKTPTPVPGSGTGLRGYYFNNTQLNGMVMQRIDARVDFNWAQGAPDAAINADYFSVRWSGQVQPFYSEVYTFYTLSDDGIRLWVNGQLLIDNWTNHAVTENSGSIALLAGQKYDIMLEYFDNAYHAVASLLWSSPRQTKSVIPTSQLYPAAPLPPTAVPTATATPTKTATLRPTSTKTPTPTQTPTPTKTATPSQLRALATTATVPGSGTGLTGSYFDNLSFTSLKASRIDATVNFDWGYSAPVSSMGSDTYTIRWTGYVEPLYSETYTFYTVSDDGVRLWVNGRQLINDWHDYSAKENKGTITLTAGQRYSITLEYYEDLGRSSIKLLWSSARQSKVVIPRRQLYPASTSTPTPAPTATPTKTITPSPTATRTPTKTYTPTATYTPTRTPAPTSTPLPAGTGTGLTGYYFDNDDLTALVMTRIDPLVNFDWGSGSPESSIGEGTFSIRWVGYVEPLFSDTYTFYTQSDDGVRLWVNGQLLVNDWIDHSVQEAQGMISLIGGQKYDIVLEYYQNIGAAAASLLWSSLRQTKSIIPTSQLYPLQAAEPEATPTFTFTPTPTMTFTPTATFTPTPTATYTFTPTATYTATPTATFTFTSTATFTATPTATFTFTSTATFTATPTATFTFTPTATFTATPTATFTFTPTATFTSTPTGAPPAQGPTQEPTSAPPPTRTPTPTTVPGPLPPAPAFPGVEGFGANAKGGRGGVICEVTTLNDSGAGSLRACIEASGPRIVVFRTAGIITLNTPLEIRNSYLTIAGQTAPGDGITLRSPENNGAALINFRDGVHDVIVRYLHLRSGRGTAGAYDAVTFYSASNIVLDHLSVTWGNDENIGMAVIDGQNSISNITIQRSIIAEALRPHSTGTLIGGSLPNVSSITLTRNLFAHNAHRNPRVDGAQRVIFAYNIIYNWYSRAGEVLRPATIDFVGNYFKAGPWSNPNEVLFYEEVGSPPSIYIEGNVAQPLQTNPAADNWYLLKYSTLNRTSSKIYLPTEWRRFTPLVSGPSQSAATTYQTVLGNVGANARLECSGTWTTRLDRVDQAIINDVINGTGPSSDSQIDHQSDFGGYPPVSSGTACTDTDHDGMPDVYEIARGFNPNNPADGSLDADGDGYTNVEEYLNGG
jgi:pectate lyase